MRAASSTSITFEQAGYRPPFPGSFAAELEACHDEKRGVILGGYSVRLGEWRPAPFQFSWMGIPPMDKKSSAAERKAEIARRTL
jgi:hypothetical protein